MCTAMPLEESQAGAVCCKTSKGTSQARRAPLRSTTSSRVSEATSSYSTVTRWARKSSSMRWCMASG